MQHCLPGISIPSQRPWTVWRDSVAGPVRWTPVPRKKTAGWFHQLRAYTREAHLGAIGRTAVLVYHALAIDFLNPDTGRCDPSYEGIAWKSNCSRRTVASALRWLRDRRMISWQRRCAVTKDSEGRTTLRQRTNAYRLHPPGEWLGWRDTTPPAPYGDTWGAQPPLPSAVESTAAAILRGDRVEAATVAVDDPLAVALIEFDRAMRERERRDITGVQRSHCISTPEIVHTSPPADASLEDRKMYWLTRLAAPDRGG